MSGSTETRAGPEPATVSVSLPSGLDAPASARRALQALEGVVAHAVLARVRLVVTELVANSVKHAESDAIRVEVSAQDGVVRGEVADGGEHFEPSREASPVRGARFGLLLVRRLTDRWGIDGDTSTVWFEVDCGRRP